MSEKDQSDSGREAADQAAAYRSMFAPQTLRFDDGSEMEIPPHPTLRMMDDDRLADYDELMFTADTEYERGPDIYIPEQTVTDRAGNELKLPPETRPGNLLVPYRRRNPETGKVELVKPPHEVKVVAVVLGDEKFAELKSKKINGRPAGAGDVWRLWNGNSAELVERRDDDSKSDGGSSVLEDAPAPDSE